MIQRVCLLLIPPVRVLFIVMNSLLLILIESEFIFFLKLLSLIHLNSCLLHAVLLFITFSSIYFIIQFRLMHLILRWYFRCKRGFCSTFFERRDSHILPWNALFSLGSTLFCCWRVCLLHFTWTCWRLSSWNFAWTFRVWNKLRGTIHQLARGLFLLLFRFTLNSINLPA